MDAPRLPLEITRYSTLLFLWLSRDQMYTEPCKETNETCLTYDLVPFLNVTAMRYNEYYISVSISLLFKVVICSIKKISLKNKYHLTFSFLYAKNITFHHQQDLCKLDVFYYQLYSTVGIAYWNEYSNLCNHEKSMEHAISTR